MPKKLTTKIYKEKLKKVGDLILLEEYIDSRTKILHKCKCGAEWNIEPERAAKPNTVCRLCGIKNREYKNFRGKKKMNAEEFDSKLLNGIKRVSEFKGVTSTMSFLCTCGEVWENKGSNMINCNTPSCNTCYVKKLRDANKKTNEEYLKELSIKGIKVTPLETYINAKTKISHKCTCGEIWNIQPERVLAGNECSICGQEKKRKAQNKDKREVLYYIKIGELYKIGICRLLNNNAKYSVRRRYTKKVEFETIYITVLDSVREAYRIEQEIIKENKDILYQGEKIMKDGNTELFTESLYKGNLINKIKEKICLQ